MGPLEPEAEGTGAARGGDVADHGAPGDAGESEFGEAPVDHRAGRLGEVAVTASRGGDPVPQLGVSARPVVGDVVQSDRADQDVVGEHRPHGLGSVLPPVADEPDEVLGVLARIGAGNRRPARDLRILARLGDRVRVRRGRSAQDQSLRAERRGLHPLA